MLRSLGGLWLLFSLVLSQLAPLGVAAQRLADPVATSFIYPVGNPNIAPTWDPTNGNGYFITQGFNDSCDPSLDQGYYAYGLYYCGHTGIDLASESADSTIHATAAGVVTEAQEDDGYGVTVRIRHTLPSGQTVYSQYEHMQYGSLEVYAGQVVSQGQALGLVGATGFASGTHLHFEIKTIDAGGPGYTFGNADEIAPFFDPLAFVAAHADQPMVLVTGTGRAIPEWPSETDDVIKRFLAHYTHYVTVSVVHGLYVRSGPAHHYSALGIALQGAKLGFIKAHGAWLYVALPQDVRGWVSSDWVAGYQHWDVPWPPRGPLAVVGELGVNMHGDPGQRHPVLGVTFGGDIVAVVAHTAHWTKIRTREGTIGWVISRYLLPPGSARPRGVGPSIVAVAPVLNVRDGPGVNYAIVGTVFSGTSMQVSRVSPHWAAVILPGGTTGWVAREYTSLAPRGTHASQSKNQAPGKPKPAVIVHVNVSVINIRSAPGERHAVIARAFRDTPLQVLGATVHWVRVALPATQLQGWVLRRLTR